MSRVCVIGAGPSGLTAAKNLVDAGFDVVVFDRGHEVGGNWVFDAHSGHSSVFETTHIISSRAYSQYVDYPMPDDYPDYPGHAQLAAYFQGYARAFDLYRLVRFGRLVVRAELTDDGAWAVSTRPDGEVDAPLTTERFDKLVVANGHHWCPRWPDVPGAFTGTYLHSHDFKRAAPFSDQRVLVIGGGNSACDVAVETSRISARTDLSWRRGYWVVPKFLFGVPSDHIHNQAANTILGRWIPTRWRLRANTLLLRLIQGSNRRYGLPEPDHDVGVTHPTINSELLYFIRHGKIGPVPDVVGFEGSTVHFADGSSRDYDAVIACTGFQIRHPFFARDFIDYSEGPVPLYLKMIHPELDQLAFIGLFQPLGCIWPAAELQAKLLARWWTGSWSPPVDRAAAIRAELDRPHIQQLDTPRHTITVDYPVYHQELVRQLGGTVPVSPAHSAEGSGISPS